MQSKIDHYLLTAYFHCSFLVLKKIVCFVMLVAKNIDLPVNRKRINYPLHDAEAACYRIEEITSWSQLILCRERHSG